MDTLKSAIGLSKLHIQPNRLVVGTHLYICFFFLFFFFCFEFAIGSNKTVELSWHTYLQLWCST